MPRYHIGPELFAFLRDLKRHNEREWFKANTPRYERDVRDPLLRFIADFAAPLGRISPHFVADARVGGSLFRIHRDTRFARDKSPYKTHAGVHFRHREAQDAHAPGFYLHLEPDNVFMGAGIWRPDGPTLTAIRDRLTRDVQGWKKALSGMTFRATCTLGGESLKRAPKGVDPDHPQIEDLKRKDFIAVAHWSEHDALGDIMKHFTAFCRTTAAFNAWLARAVGLKF